MGGKLFSNVKEEKSTPVDEVGLGKLFSNVSDVKEEKPMPIFEVGLGKLFSNGSDVEKKRSTPVFEVVLKPPQPVRKRCREEKENDASKASAPLKQSARQSRVRMLQHLRRLN